MGIPAGLYYMLAYKLNQTGVGLVMVLADARPTRPGTGGLVGTRGEGGRE